MRYNEQFIVTTYNIAHNWIVLYRVQKACGCLHKEEEEYYHSISAEFICILNQLMLLKNKV
jgi:hypothetical protein